MPRAFAVVGSRNRPVHIVGRMFCRTYVRFVVIPLLSWSGYGWVVKLDMKQNPTTRTVTWKCTESNMQNTHAREETTIAFTLTPAQHHTRLDFTHTGYRESPC
jgi:hypothetical protein